MDVVQLGFDRNIVIVPASQKHITTALQSPAN
jgi:hypothetical protein